MFLSHAPISYLANEAIQKEKIKGLKPSQEIFVVVMSLLFGILPDMDFLLMLMFRKPSYSHHDMFTQTFFYWVVLWLLLSLVVKVIYPSLKNKTKQFFTKDMIKILLNAFLIGGISHLVADILVGNIMLLYPLSTQNFTVLKYIFEPSYFTGYFLSVYFAIEIVLFVLGIYSLAKRFMKKQKWDDIVAYILLALSGMYLLFSIYINTQTYNNSFLGDSAKPTQDYDMDYDTLRDTEDLDVDNDGVDNILDVEKEEIVRSLSNIIDSNKATVSQNGGINNWIMSKFGGLTSYRVISQAYYENSSTIEPVLTNFYIKSSDIKDYSPSYNHIEVLRDYFLSKELIIDLNTEGNPTLESGQIFFVIDENDEVLNLGMTLENNEVAIVLPGERNIQYHTFDGVKMFYEDITTTFQISQSIGVVQ